MATRAERHTATLERRREYLDTQVRERTERGQKCDWAKSERAALVYALAVIRDAKALGLELGEATS